MPTISPKQLLEQSVEWDLVQGTWATDWAFPFHLYSPQTNHYEKAWLAAELACRHRVDDLVRQWLKTLRLPQMTPEELYWFQLRFRAAARLLGMVVLDNGTSIFSTGNHTLEDVQMWTLIEWWASVGNHEAMFGIVEKDFGQQTQSN